MRILNFFRSNRKSATVAKERLQIIVSHESQDNNKDFLKDLQRELLGVISKYVNIDPGQINVQLDQTGDQSVLELNVTLPDADFSIKTTTPKSKTHTASSQEKSKETSSATESA